MYVKTDYTGCEYVTAGKVYECLSDGEGYIEIEVDDGGLCAIGMWTLMDELNGPQLLLDDIGTWTICDKEGNEL